MNKRKKINKVIYHIVVIAFGVIMIYPLLWMFFSSFKDTSEIFREAGKLLPESFNFDNYINGWKGFAGISFTTFFKNSIVICGLSTIGGVVSSCVIAFGFARLNFKFKKFWFMCMMLTMMLPFQVVMIPQFIMFNEIGWVGSILPLVVPEFFGKGFFIFLMIQFIQGIPIDLDEAAKIDGCSIYGIFGKIILPLIKPAIMTAAIFAFVWKWDDFLGSLLYLNNPKKYPVNLALKMFCDPSSQSDWGAMFAMACLSLLPIFLIFITFQKYIVEGISTTGLKG